MTRILIADDHAKAVGIHWAPAVHEVCAGSTTVPVRNKLVEP